MPVLTIRFQKARPKGATAWIRFLARGEEIQRIGLERALGAAAERIRQRTPLRTGQTAAAWRISGRWPRYRLVGHEKALYLIFGTRPHVIRPRHRRALYWPDIQVGHPVAIVFHPGARPKIAWGEIVEAISQEAGVKIPGTFRELDP